MEGNSLLKLPKNPRLPHPHLGVRPHGTRSRHKPNRRGGPSPPVGDCIGNIDFDGTVAVTDLLTLLAAWGPCP